MARGGDAGLGRARRGGELAGRGAFVLETIAGELPDDLAETARSAAGGLWLPFSAATAEALLELRGARMDQRALRCATRLQVGQEPAPATLSLVESVGEPRFTLDVNWDPETIPAFLALPACRGARPLAAGRPLPARAARALPAHLRRRGRAGAPRRCSSACAPSTTRRSPTSAARARTTRRRSPSRRALGGELRPFQRAGVAYVLRARRTFLADEQGLGKTVQALAALEEDGAYPAVVVCPASLKLNWQRETERWLPHRSVDRRLGHRRRSRPAPT